MTEIKFKPIFPSPLGFANFGNSNKQLNKDLIDDIEDHMKKTKGGSRTFKKNESSWQSKSGLENQYESFRILRDLIDRVSKPVLVQSGFKEEYVMASEATGLWANVVFDVGGYARPHLHGTGRTLWSGVYYPQGLEEIENLDEWDEDDTFYSGYPSNVDGMLVLFDPAKTTKGLVRTKHNSLEFYGTECSIKPRESLLILFPVWMLHMVTPLTKKTKRYSISFSINNGALNG